MSDSIRTFVAVKFPLPPALRPVLRSLATMNRPVVPVSSDEMHVTLKFLGDTPNDLREAIQQRIAQAVADQPPFDLHAEGIGAFPNADRPSVLWAGLKPTAPLVALAQRLENALEPLGFARESRPFHPHLTLARIKGRPPRELFDLMRDHATTNFGTVKIDAVEFFQSDLSRRDGSRYSVLASCKLTSLNHSVGS